MMKTSPGSTFAVPRMSRLHPYVPGTQPEGTGWVKLNTNENPYPPSPRATEAIRRECARLRLYPNPISRPLRRALGEHWGVGETSVIVGNGSDDILNLILRAFAGPEHPVGWAEPSYSLYPVLAAARECPTLRIPFPPSMELPVEAIAASGANLFLLTSPNAPTGVGFPNASMRDLLSRFPGLLVVDEAYADFAPETAMELVREHPRLVVVRTFSKSYGLAGLRVGYAVGDPSVIDMLDRVRDSYNVDRLAQAGALAALTDQPYFQHTVTRILETREVTVARFRQMGWKLFPSAANFVLVQPKTESGETGPAVARALFDSLFAQRILVRYLTGNPLTEDALRVTIGTESEMDKLFQAIASWQNPA